jgi:hypothetical protein
VGSFAGDFFKARRGLAGDFFVGDFFKARRGLAGDFFVGDFLSDTLTIFNINKDGKKLLKMFWNV